MTGYLPQALVVENLIKAVMKNIDSLPEGENKESLIAALKQFEVSIVPSTIYLEEIEDYMAEHSIVLNQVDMVNILKETAMDMDLNYVNKAVEYHCDEYICSLQN